MSFRLKLLAYFLSLLGAVLAASLWTVNTRETRKAESEVRAGLVSAHAVFEKLLENRERQLATAVRLLSGDFAFKQAVATADPATVLSAAANHRSRIGADLLLVADAEGLLLADTRRKLKPGRPLKKLSVVARAVTDEKAAAMVQIFGGAPTQFAAVPITAPDMIGVLAAGFLIDDALASDLKRLTGADIVFAAGGKIFASTLDPARRDAFVEILPGLTCGKPDLRTVGQERQLMLASEPAPQVTAVVMRSWDKALEPMEELQRLLLRIGGIGLAATALLGLLIAAGVTASLKKLVDATAKVAAGQYDVAVDIPSRDEIGQLGRAFTKMATGLREREKIRSVLRKAVSKEIAEALLSKGEIELGGEERTVSVLFSDIRSFTTISEALAPKELVTQLNAYFIGMSHAIDSHHGVIDKFVGDAIMALFGAPLSSPQDAANAVRAALAMAKALDETNEARRKAGMKPWRNGMGVNTGTVVAGTLGSEDRWSYTVIGDAVNLASRCEGLTNHYGVRVIVTDATRAAAGDGFACRPLDRVVVKGKHEPVEIFDVLGEGPGPAWLGRFGEGVALYRAQKWPEARAAFAEVLRQSPEDAPARMYLERLEELARNPPGADWDSAAHMTEK